MFDKVFVKKTPTANKRQGARVVVISGRGNDSEAAGSGRWR